MAYAEPQGKARATFGFFLDPLSSMLSARTESADPGFRIWPLWATSSDFRFLGVVPGTVRARTRRATAAGQEAAA